MKTIFCLAALFCSTHISAQKEYSIASINQDLLKYANSIVIEESVEVDVTDINKMKIKTRRVTAVLNKLGDQDPNLFEFYDDNSKVRDVEARIYNASGKEIGRYKKRDFTDVSRTGNNMYADNRVAFLRYTPTTYPYIVVYTSETETGDSAFLPSWYPLGGYATSTQKSVLQIKFNPANKPKYKPQNLEGHDIAISETPGTITFSGSNLKAVRYEEHSPSPNKVLPNILLGLDSFKLKGTEGSGKDWQAFGSWMDQSLLRGLDVVPEGTLARVRNLVANETTNEGKARKIYQYVQDKVRYISIQIGIGGWKPMAASDVDKLSYGDCKALTNYTKVLLEAVGVPSYYTVLYGDIRERNIDPEFTSLQGNHAILGIPDGEDITWLECTSQDTPYGYIGSFTDDRDALIITPEGGKIVRTKVYDTNENTQQNISRVKIHSDGSVDAHLSRISQGLQYEDKYLLPKKKRDEIDEFYKKQWSHINGFSLDNFEFDDDRQNIIFTENVNVSIPNYANLIGEDYLFCANVFNQINYTPPRIENRMQNLYLGYGYLDTDTVEVEIPENFIIEMLPEAIVLETKFGKYEMAFVKTSDTTIKYHRSLRVDKGEYPPAEYENFRGFLRTIARLDKTKILLKQNVQ